MRNLIRYFVEQRLFGNLLTLFVVVLGLASTFMIRRDVFPNVNFDVITISTIFPGGSPEEVEKLITNPIEQDLTEIDGIKKLRSVSVEGRSVIILQLDPDQATELEVKADVQDIVDLFEKPEGVEDPKVTSVTSKNTPIIEVALQSELDPVEFRAMARRLERELERVPGVAKVVPRGIEDLEIKVETDPRKLAQYRLSLEEVVQALRGQNVSIPAGTIEARRPVVEDAEKIVRTVGEFKDSADVGRTVIRSNEYGRPIRVSDVATVKYGLKKTQLKNRTNGFPSISLTVLKKEKADAVTVVEKIKEAMNERSTALQAEGVRFTYVNDLSEFIRRRIGILSSNLFFGLSLVLLILTLILRLRVALIVSLGIPFSFLGGMIIFHQMDLSLNLISLLGFIIVSGMLVDDAVVVTDNIARRMEKGEEPSLAAVEGTVQIWKAVTASVLTTIVAFLPMLFMSGIFGKFVRQIPIGVILALLASLFEAFLILPQHIAHFVRLKDVHPEPKDIRGIARVGEAFKQFWDNRVTPRYVRILTFFVHHRWKTVGGAFLLFVASLGLASVGMRFVLFPPEGIEIFFVRLQAPTTASLDTTEAYLKRLEAEIEKLPEEEVKDYVTMTGIHQNDPNDPNTKRGSHYGQIAVYLHPEQDRSRTAAEIIDALRKNVPKPEEIVSLTFERAGGGPPVGKPISVAVRGDSYPEILAAVKDLEDLVKEIPGAQDVTNSYYEGKEEVQVIVNPVEARAAQLSVAQVGNTVRAAFDGLVPTSIRLLDDEVDVRVSFTKRARSSEDSLDQILVPNGLGNLIPLTSISSVQSARGLSAFDHEANQREVRVLGEIDTEISSARTIAKQVEQRFPELQKKHPKVRFAFGGEEEDTQESLASLIRAFALAAMGILFILILTFGSILQPVLVLLSVPFGIIGVIWAFFLHGMPLSFMGMLGVVALAGVIVNNAIVFIDFVNNGRKEGLGPTESIIAAGGMRLRAIFLTTFTTVCGLMPTAYGFGGEDKFVVPIAMALGWGLVGGSILTAFVLPAAVHALDDIQALGARIRSRVGERTKRG